MRLNFELNNAAGSQFKKKITTFIILKYCVTQFYTVNSLPTIFVRRLHLTTDERKLKISKHAALFPTLYDFVPD